MWKTIGIYVALVAFGAFFTSNGMQAAEQTGGMVTFHGEGNYQEFPPDFGLWTGIFYGGGTTDSESGPLHRSGWDCTGELAYQGGTPKFGGGFCNHIWQTLKLVFHCKFIKIHATANTELKTSRVPPL